MTTVEVPYSIAAALPSLVVVDITNDVGREVAAAGPASGIAYISAAPECLVRVNERESGFFEDVEDMLRRIVPDGSCADRVRVLSLVLGPKTEQVPFQDRRLCLGRWQRILLFGLDGVGRSDWTLTFVG